MLVFFRTILFFCFCCHFLCASEAGSFQVRVAIIRNAPTLETVFQTPSKKEYTGTIRIIKNHQGKYDAINILDIEDFLMGVIGQEMSPTAPLEALKAQAVAARSHALYQVNISANQPYDLVANLSQAYAGKTELHKNVVLAIESTRGEILYYHGKPIPAFFHSSCGGHTESAVSVWQTISNIDGASSLELPPSVRCPYCAKSNGQKWNFEISAATLKRILEQAGYSLGTFPTIAISEKATGGHAQTIAVHSNVGDFHLPADKFRALLGYSCLSSTLFEISQETLPNGTPGDTFRFRGEGYGHGVGLCQYGAQEMAEQKASYDNILSYYFPNSYVQPYAPQTWASTR